ncbi:hypothetical protein GJ654_12405 [Rhodoblastus acidophilus]|uniref:Uncharacterized protein n=1 Tax=Rhodoblastus acidophilus TaxID=1074 RepID=A0A6N8DN86_RHOAC|nr:hypothetical protein [Rhodoblastus acidophilus]MCW2275320.1 hypothetical protein [Rhodoblastus acidophilus]MTV31788.1 hypothetical protein [Rhodoblastus acidophilus]
MRNPFRDEANRLRREEGAVARRAWGQSAPDLRLPTRYAVGLAAGACLLVIVLCVAGLAMRFPTVMDHLRGGRIAALDRLTAAGINVEAIEPLDLRSFLATKPEARAALIEIARMWSPAGQHALVDLFKHSNTPAKSFEALIWLAHRLDNAPGRTKLTFAAAEIDEETASRLTANIDFSEFIRALGIMSMEDARLVARAGFPVVPKNAAQADLVRSVLDPTFPATTGAKLLDLAKASPERAAAVSQYLRDGAMLKNCKPVACAQQPPAACYLANGQCPAGHYPTIASIQCAPLPPGMSFAK